MSRLLIASTLVALFTSVAAADRVEPRFAQPPPTSASEAQAPRHIRADMPARVLDREQVRAALAANRIANLARFRVYQRGGVFPSNTYSDGSLNVWRDEAGHFCAAATIIKLSGQDALVTRVAEQTNFIRLATVEQGPLMDWILTSGLTQAEIAAIQEPMDPVSQIRPDQQPRVVDAGMRKSENARLVAKYRQVDAMIVKNQAASLDRATDLLMKRHDLAWQLVDG
ncbi:MAG: hypothetical protein ABI867_11480 [Kofleriaceae bacterium]